jgi:hypothetical protein
MFGALAKQLASRKLHAPRPQAPFEGRYLDDVCRTIQSMESPIWSAAPAIVKAKCTTNHRQSHDHCSVASGTVGHTCSLKRELDVIVLHVNGGVEGLNLSDMKEGTGSGC